MKRNFIKTTQDHVIIYPDKPIKFLGWFFLGLSIACGLAGYVLLNSQNSGIDLFPLILMLPILLVSLAILLLAERHVVFDKTKAAVFNSYGFFQTKLIDFNAIDSIRPVTNDVRGTYFGIVRNSDRYGKSIRISAGFPNNSTEKAVFENDILPLLAEAIQSAFPTANHTVNTARNIPAEVINGDYKHYVQRANGWQMKGAMKPIVIPLIILLAGAVWFTLSYLKKGAPPANFKIWYILVPAFAIGFLHQQIIFDRTNRVIKVKRFFGLNVQAYSFDSFVRFHITRIRTSLVYSGTRVSVALDSKGKKFNKVIELATMYNTKKIDRFIRETESILFSK